MLNDSDTGQDTAQDKAQDTGQDAGQDTGQDFDPEKWVSREEFNKTYGEMKQAKLKLRNAEGKAISDEDRADLGRLREAEEMAEQDKMAQKGQFQEALTKREEKYTSELNQRDETIGRREKSISDLLIKNQILIAATATASDPDMVVKLLDRNFNVEFGKDGEHVVKAFLDNGDPWYGENGDPATVKYVVDKYLDEHDNLKIMSAARGSGGPAKNLGGSKTNPAIPSMEEQADMSLEEIKAARKRKPSMVRTQ